MSKSAPSHTAVIGKMRAAALALPETTEEFPWGSPVFKVRKKVFVFLSLREDSLSFTVKLPHTHLMAKEMPGVAATGYGLGKSGWVTLTLVAGDKPDIALLLDWMAQSYAAVAPRVRVRKGFMAE